MGVRFFSDKKRPVHLGPYPLERLKRGGMPDLEQIPAAPPLSFHRPNAPENVVNAMRDYQAMLDAIRDGLINPARADIPVYPKERSNHLKSFGYFNDASMVGIAKLTDQMRLDAPFDNPDIDRIAEMLRTHQTKTLAAGIDQTMADLKDGIEAPPSSIADHTHAVVFLYANPRKARVEEPGADWVKDAHAHRACLRATETAAVIANYIRILGFDAKAHSPAATDVNLGRVTAAAGLAWIEGDALVAPYVGPDFGVAIVTCALDLAVDLPLAPREEQPWFKTEGPAWWLGKGFAKSALTQDPFENRRFADGPHPFERIKRVESPTTFIDEPNVARVPKRADMFARAQFGDMGKNVQDAATGGKFARKSATAQAQRRALGAFVLLGQDVPNEFGLRPDDAQSNADAIKAVSYFLGVDAVGISRCPDWTWYSHDATGEPIDPPHDQAISMIIDQGYDTMEGASGDDWISVAQSMRAYLRFSLLGGVIAQQIRNLGYKAKAHTSMDGDVLQPPLLLLSGLGEVSRIGEVILNPYLGPRLKSGVVTTDMPMAHDKPIDFGLQAFCEACNKCARECPSGAITAGPKLMFNGYEIWKSDSQKCATYRMTTEGGAMCGRCMKTCPWNLEGIFSEAPFRWMASNIPSLARPLAKLDDAVGNGTINPVKKWWWDLELAEDGAYRAAKKPPNERELQTDLDLKYEDQTLAVYPAPLAPHPWPYPFPMDREAGIQAYQSMITAEEYRKRLAAGDVSMVHRFETPDLETAPVIRVELAKVEAMTPDVSKYEFRALDGQILPEWTAGAHLDVLVTPEFLRQYSMSGNPADRTHYQIGVLREDEGRGGSAMLHRIFSEGRKVFVSKPINHFELVEEAEKTFLMGGGIGITPMIAFAHRLHALSKPFELHFSAWSRSAAGYLQDLADAPWAENVHFHFSDEGSRADFDKILSGYKSGLHVYACGPDRFMSSVMDAAERQGFPEDARHLEYFSIPEQPDYENHAFTARLKRRGKEVHVPAEQTLAEALVAQGVPLDIKCSDGICGVCKCGLVSGEVEHRDFVLSQDQRRNSIITCQSRAADPDGVIELDL